MKREDLLKLIADMVMNDPCLVIDIDHLCKDLKEEFRSKKIYYGNGGARHKGKKNEQQVSRIVVNPTITFPEDDNRISTKAERRSTINKEVVEAIKDDPNYSRELLRLVKDIRRAQRGKTSNLSDEDRDFFLDNKD